MDKEINYIGKCLLIENNEVKKSLVIGDLHIGYEESLNERGVFISRRMFDEGIDYLNRVFAKTGKVDKIILLGDVKHEFGKILRQEWKEVFELIDYFREKLGEGGEIIIVKGNHDKILGAVVGKKGIEIVDYFIDGEFAFLHGDRDFEEIHDSGVRYWIVGHGHPAVRIGDGTKVENYKCFLVGKFKGKEVIVVPSFFEGVIGSDVRESELGLAWDFNFEKFRVMAVGGGFEVLDFGLLGEMEV